VSDKSIFILARSNESVKNCIRYLYARVHTRTHNKFQKYAAMTKAMHGCKIAKLHVDNYHEYMSNKFKQFCKNKILNIKFYDYTAYIQINL